MRLLKRQKNELFEVIEEFGFSPSQFSFEDDKENESTLIDYKNHDGYCFKIFNDEVSFIPGASTLSQEGIFLEWSGVYHWFRTWLECIEVEVSIVDKWKEFERELQALNVDFSTENEKFSHAEYKEIELRMGLLKSELSAIPEFQDHLINIYQKLDHLTAMVEDLGKFDWRSLFVGTIVSMVTTLGVTPDTASTLWESVKRIFSTYLLKQ